MKALQINGYETPGSRFHGLAITPQLKKYGIESQHFAWLKDTDRSDVLSFNDPKTQTMSRVYRKIEEALSLQSMLYPYGKKIMELPEFNEADLVHLHIIHSGFF